MQSVQLDLGPCSAACGDMCSDSAPSRDVEKSARARSAGAFDVVIVGAGPAGSSAALSLARRGVRVALVERSSFEASRIGEALAPAVQGELVALGAWREVQALGPLPSWGTRALWGDEQPHAHSHLTSPYGHGWQVDRRAFDEALAQAAARAGAQLMLGATLRVSESQGEAWQLLVERRRPGARAPREARANAETGSAGLVSLSSRVLIDATGRPAAVGRALGAQRLLFDRLVGVATCWEPLGTGERGHLLVETAGEGWWYSARLPPGSRDVSGEPMLAMLMTDADLCAEGQQHRRSGWHAALDATHATRQRLHGARCIDAPRVHLAHSQRVQRADRSDRAGRAGRTGRTASRLLPWLAVGDAALAVDPLSGSGVLRALRSGRAGAETAARMLEQPAIARDALAAYEAEQDAECTTFLIERAQHYAAEQRFDTPFWKRRQVGLRARSLP